MGHCHIEAKISHSEWMKKPVHGALIALVLAFGDEILLPPITHFSSEVILALLKGFGFIISIHSSSFTNEYGSAMAAKISEFLTFKLFSYNQSYFLYHIHVENMLLYFLLLTDNFYETS